MINNDNNGDNNDKNNNMKMYNNNMKMCNNINMYKLNEQLNAIKQKKL